MNREHTHILAQLRRGEVQDTAKILLAGTIVRISLAPRMPDRAALGEMTRFLEKLRANLRPHVHKDVQ